MKIYFSRKSEKVVLGYMDDLPVNDQWVEVCKISVEPLRNKYITRPAGSLGNCGFYPFPWSAAYGKNPTQAAKSFLESNEKDIVNKFKVVTQ
jgi:hypothetical protein